MKINKKFFLQGTMAIIALIALISCPADSDSSDDSSSNYEAYIVYGDEWHSDINADALYFNGPEAPHVFATSDETGGHSNTEGNMLKVDFSGLTAEGWNGINAHLSGGATVNLSRFKQLSFYAKADSADTKIKEFILTDGADVPTSLKMVNTAFTTDWVKYTIPIVDGSFLSDTSVIFQLVHDYATGGLGVVYLDDILFDTSQPPTPTTITYNVETLNVAVNDAVTLPTELTLVYDNYSIIDPTGSIVRWASSDTSIATVQGNSVTGVAAGSATLTATLLGTSVTTDITINVVETENTYFISDVHNVALPGDPTWTYYGGYDGTITATEVATGGADGSDKYTKLTGSEAQTWAAGGWGDAVVDMNNLIALVFWAKSDTSTEIKFAFQDVANVQPEIAQAITATWTKYTLPKSVFTGVNFAQIKTLKYVLPANNAVVDIDEVYIVSAGSAATDALDISTLDYKYVDPSAVFILPAGTNHVLSPIWSIAPNSVTYASTGTQLPDTFALDANTGAITITAPVVTEETSYTITATGGGSDTGTKAADFKIQIIAADTDEAKYRLFGSSADFVGEFFAGYEGTMTATESTTATDKPYMLLADTQSAAWSAGGYQPTTPIDQTKYTYFVVEARKVDGATDEESQLEILLKYDSDGKAGAKVNITSYSATGTATNTPVATTFTIHKIPLSVLKGTQSTKTTINLTFINLEFPYEEVDAATAKGYKVEVGDIYLE